MANARVVTEDDIRTYLCTNWNQFPSQIALIQAAVQSLWRGKAPTAEAERVVRLCLEMNLQPVHQPYQADARVTRSVTPLDSH